MNAVAHAENEVAAAQNSLVAARPAVRTQLVDNRQRKAAFDKAVVAFQAEFAPIRREALVRQTIAADRQRSADLKAGRIPFPQRPRIAKSVIDRTAAYSTGGDADDLARRMSRVGHHRGYIDPRTGE
jgi:hypothetical protein